MVNVTKRQLTERIARKLGKHPKEIFPTVQALMEEITATLARGHRIEFRNFGIFDVVKRNAKVGRNPKDPKQDIPIPPRKAARFKPGKHFIERLQYR